MLHCTGIIRDVHARIKYSADGKSEEEWHDYSPFTDEIDFISLLLNKKISVGDYIYVEA